MLEAGLSVFGVLTIFAALLIVPADRVQLQIMVTLAGILALEAGIWGLTQQLMPNDRQFVDLRVEGEHFIDLMRDLNQAVLASRGGASDAEGDSEEIPVRFEEALARMHESVDRMGKVRWEGELTTGLLRHQ
jgi:hypothetical protein